MKNRQGKTAREKGGEEVKLIIEAEPKEIAALVLAVQERQEIKISSEKSTEADMKYLSQYLRSVLSQPVLAENQKQQLDSSTHIQNLDKESHYEEPGRELE